ncbi:MAG: glycosyl hydrolase 53 family protein [Bacteroidales bacterium]
MKTILNPYIILKNSLSVNTREECALYTEQICTPHFKYIGGDLSLLSRYRESRAVYIDDDNQSVSDLLHYCGENGFNTIRCRLLVNPEKDHFSCQNFDYVLNFAKEIKAHGFEFCLCIHYSDKYADSALQEKPSEWSDFLLDELQQEVYLYTKKILLKLEENGLLPDLIQIGNGLENGFLWDDGLLHEDYSKNNREWKNFLSLINPAINAVREVCGDNLNIILGIDSLENKERAFEFFARLMSSDVDFNTIGLSYKPYRDGDISDLVDFIDNLLCLNGSKDILFMEVSTPYDYKGVPFVYRDDMEYEPTPMGQKATLYNMIKAISAFPQVSGILYWNPEDTFVNEKSNLHTNYAGLFNNKSGHVMPAFSVFKLLNRTCR